MNLKLIRMNKQSSNVDSFGQIICLRVANHHTELNSSSFKRARSTCWRRIRSIDSASFASSSSSSFVFGGACSTFCLFDWNKVYNIYAMRGLPVQV
jgi:hypothetical protein